MRCPTANTFFITSWQLIGVELLGMFLYHLIYYIIVKINMNKGLDFIHWYTCLCKMKHVMGAAGGVMEETLTQLVIMIHMPC